MATTHLIGFLQSGIVTSAGVALASGKVRFYQPGTLTPETVYSDGAGATPIVQPVTLSAGGTATVYSLNPIRVQIKDALDTTLLFDLDQADTVSASGLSVQSATFNNNVAFTLKAAFDAWSTSFGGTAGMWKGKIGTTERNVKDMIKGIAISVSDYGAVGDNITDDTTAIQNAMNAAIAASAELQFPPGQFKITAAIAVSNAIRMRGSGTGSTFILQTSTTANCFTGAAAAHMRIRDLQIGAATTSSGSAIVGSAAIVALDNVTCITTFASVVSGTGNTVYILGGSSIFGNTTGVIMTSGVALTIVGSDVNGTTNATTHGCPAYFSGSTFPSGIVAISGGTTRASACSFNTVTLTGTSIFLPTTSTTASSINDSRAGSPGQFSLASSTSVTPLPDAVAVTKIKETLGGATVTINQPTLSGGAGGFDHGRLHTISCSNASGGAVTWTFNAIFHTSGAVAPATGNRISVTFYYDAIDTNWYEISRSAAVPN